MTGDRPAVPASAHRTDKSHETIGRFRDRRLARACPCVFHAPIIVIFGSQYRIDQNTVGRPRHRVPQFLDISAAVVGPEFETLRATLDVATANIAAHFVPQDTGDRNGVAATASPQRAT